MLNTKWQFGMIAVRYSQSLTTILVSVYCVNFKQYNVNDAIMSVSYTHLDVYKRQAQ